MLTDQTLRRRGSNSLPEAFWRLWWGQTSSMVGTQVTAFAVPIIAVVTLDASAWQMGLITGSGTLAVLVLSLPFGALVDRHDHRTTMILSGMARAGTIAVLPVAFLVGQLTVGLVCVVAFVNGGLGILHSTAFAALLPSIVPPAKLEKANGLVETSDATGEVLGPTVAGGLTQLVTPAVTLFVDAASYLVAAIFTMSIPRQVSSVEAADEPEHEPVLKAARSGLRALRAHTSLWRLTQAAALFNLFTAAYFTLFVLYAVRGLHLRPFQIGIVATLAGAGGVVGSLIAAAVTSRLGTYRTLIAVYLVPAVTAVACVAVPPGTDGWTLAISIGALQLAWVAAVVINLVISTSFLQRNAPKDMLGRFVSTTQFVTWGVEPLGALAAGGAAAITGSTRPILLLSGGALALGALPLLTARSAIERNADDVAL